MERTVMDDQSKRVFGMLAEEEKHHLDRMTSLIEKKADDVSLDNDMGIR
jgi:rubrerythrin